MTLWLFATLWTVAGRILCPWNSSSKNTKVGSHCFSRGSSWPRHQSQVSCIAGRFFTIWATKEAHKHESEVAQSCPTLCNTMDCSYQAPQSMGFSRQKYWSGLPFLSPGDLPNPGIEPRSPVLQAVSFLTETSGKPYKHLRNKYLLCCQKIYRYYPI